MQPRILIINGPGFGDHGDRDWNGYTGLSPESIRKACQQLCNDLDVDMDYRQASDQEVMAQWIAKDSGNFDGLIINPADYSQASNDGPVFCQSALRNAAKLEIPAIEVHITNIYRSGDQVAQSLHESGGEMGFIGGFGMRGYLMAIKAIVKRVSGDS
jgi:3-dehydroquinate dehydratase-2